jgi:hypothetical protein
MQLPLRLALFIVIFLGYRLLRLWLFKNNQLSRWQTAFLYAFLWGSILYLAVVFFEEMSYWFPFGFLLFLVNFLAAIPIMYLFYPVLQNIKNKPKL